jgi:TRAP-type C4-dicarboxylate transport system permease small subunit
VLAFFRRIGSGGMAIGAAFLTAMMVLIVANVIYRLFGHVIPGSYEMSELMIVVAAAFALGYAAIHGSHVVVKIVVTRFSQRWQAILTVIMSLISIATWAIIAWATADVLSKRWLTEVTDLLDIPYLPFRIILVVGLVFLCLIYVTDLVSALRQVTKK